MTHDPSRHPPASVRTLVDLLRLRAAEAPDRRMYVFLADGERESASWTRGELLERASTIAGSLQSAGLRAGDVALLVYPQGLDFVAALLGCLLAGVVAVPSPAPDPDRLDRTAPRLASIARDSGSKALLVHSSLDDLARHLPPDLANVTWLRTDLPGSQPTPFVPVAVGSQDVAYLQYTSGSTRSPKGVMLDHANVLAQLRMIQDWHAHPTDRPIVSWLPTFHDFGLVYGVFHALYVGSWAVLMSPQAMIARPMRWLRAVSRYGAAGSPSPNFGLDLCVAKSTPAERQQLDLSGWHVINGAEPIHEESVRRFCDAFAGAGVAPERVVHGYGLAEATLVLTLEPWGMPGRFVGIDGDAYERNEVVLVSDLTPGRMVVASCGAPLDTVSFVVVDPITGERLGDQRVGELWVRGDTVARGYWKNEEATRETFRATLDGVEGGWLRTGDLGFLHDGRVWVSGRHKDLIVVHGANKHPQDLEWAIQSAHEAFRPNCGAAFGVYENGEERLVFVSEVRPEFVDDMQRVYAAVWEAAGQHGLTVARIVLIPPRTLPKTSSGKIQRRQTRELLAAGQLQIVAEWYADPPKPGSDAAELRARIAERPKRARVMVLERLRARAAAAIGLQPDQVRSDRPLRDQGLDSVAAAEFVEWLERVTNTELGVATVFACADLEELADLVLRRLQS